MEDTMALAKLRTEEILTFFGLNISVKAEAVDGTIELSVPSDDSGRLIGHHGETLAALQQLLNAIVRSHTAEQVYVSLDIADYKKARAEQLTAEAKRDAEQVLATGEPKPLRPMNAAERRVVHMALADMPELATDSEGTGPQRRVVIKKRV